LLWVENTSIEPKKKFENKIELEQKDFMNDIKNESVRKEWTDIGLVWIRKCPICHDDITHSYKPKKWHLKLACKECGRKKKVVIHTKEEYERKCPKCEDLIVYTNVGNRNMAEKKKKLCLKCVSIQLSIKNTGKKLTQATKEKLSDIFKGRPILWKDKIGQAKKKFYKEHPNELPKGNKNPMFGVHRIGSFNPNFGKRWNSEQRKRARLNTIHNLKNKGIKFGYKGANNYNPKACQYFNWLNESNGWNLQHAENGGEISIIGYFLDSYDKTRNIVVEYDEKHHNKLSQQMKDLRRQTDIIEELKCDFYRFNESKGELVKI